MRINELKRDIEKLKNDLKPGGDFAQETMNKREKMHEHFVSHPKQMHNLFSSMVHEPIIGGPVEQEIAFKKFMEENKLPNESDDDFIDRTCALKRNKNETHEEHLQRMESELQEEIKTWQKNN
jgi:hypothetical protein